MNRYFLWYKSKDGYERFRVFKNRDSIWKFITSFDVVKIYKIKYVKWYEVLYFYIRQCFLTFYDFISMSDYHTPEENMIKDCNAYESSDGRLVYKVFKDLGITKNDSVIDIGSGKGYVLKVLSRFPFKRIYGVEIMEDLVNSANKNAFTKDNQYCPTVLCDATEFSDYYLFNYIVMFNPFEGEKMEEFLLKICDKDGLTVVYNNPVCKELMKKYGFKVIKRYKGILGSECWVYKN